jgi:hypothetical protein
MTQMEIKPEIGIGELKFGIKLADVEKILGKADSVEPEKDDEHRIIVVYNKQRLRLTFYENENNKLGYIISSNPNLNYNGINIINSNIDFIKNEVFNKIISNWEIEDYDSFISHFEEKYWLTLHSEFETVTTLELGVPYKNEEEYNWPK